MAIVIKRFIEASSFPSIAVSGSEIGVSGISGISGVSGVYAVQSTMTGSFQAYSDRSRSSDYLSIGVSGSGVPASGINILVRPTDTFYLYDRVIRAFGVGTSGSTGFSGFDGVTDSTGVSDSLQYAYNTLNDLGGDTIITSDSIGISIGLVKLVSDDTVISERLVRGTGLVHGDRSRVIELNLLPKSTGISDNIITSDSLRVATGSVFNITDTVYVTGQMSLGPSFSPGFDPGFP